MVLCLFLMQSLCSSGPRVSEVEEDYWVYVYKAIVEFVELPQTNLSFLLLKTWPLDQISERGCNTTC